MSLIITNIIIILIILFIIATTIISIYHLKTTIKKVKTQISFRESMDLVELPIITFYNDKTKLNFLLDTGCNNSCINSSVLPYLNYISYDGNSSLTDFAGNKYEKTFCEMVITRKDKSFTGIFGVVDLDAAFKDVKDQSGVQLHGILGNDFFTKYKYVLDFVELIAYNK